MKCVQLIKCTHQIELIDLEEKKYSHWFLSCHCDHSCLGLIHQLLLMRRTIHSELEKLFLHFLQFLKCPWIISLLLNHKKLLTVFKPNYQILFTFFLLYINSCSFCQKWFVSSTIYPDIRVLHFIVYHGECTEIIYSKSHRVN